MSALIEMPLLRNCTAATVLLLELVSFQVCKYTSNSHTGDGQCVSMWLASAAAVLRS